MPDFGLVKSFHIDNGELDGQSPQQCFVLGYELAQIDEQLKTGRAVNRPVHAANRDRISESCRDANRDFDLTWASDDTSESWMTLVVRAESF